MAATTPKDLGQAQANASSGAPTTVYAVPNNTTAVIANITLCNTDTSTRTISVELVPDGGTVGAAHRIFDSQPIAPHETIEGGPYALKGGAASTAKVAAFSDVANKVTVTVCGAEVA